MKPSIFISSILIALQISCTAQKQVDNTKTAAFEIQKQNMAESISMTEESRGNMKIYTFTERQIMVSKNGMEESLPLKAEDWNKLQKIVATLNLEKINTYEAPSQNRWSDASASTQINIKTQSGLYTSQTFDAGVPPKELVEVYKTIITLTRPQNKVRNK